MNKVKIITRNRPYLFCLFLLTTRKRLLCFNVALKSTTNHYILWPVALEDGFGQGADFGGQFWGWKSTSY